VCALLGAMLASLFTGRIDLSTMLAGPIVAAIYLTSASFFA